MKVAVLIHFYVPYRCAGSETMLHAMCKELIAAGHELAVFATVMPEAPTHYEYEGVEVIVTNMVYAQSHIKEWKPDVIISHHDNTVRAKNLSLKLQIPFVFVCHNSFDAIHRTLDLVPDLVVYNTHWVKEALNRPEFRSTIVHPPVFAEQHKTTPGDKVTLVNLNADKGSGILYELARRMPDIEFLAVEGAHGTQIMPPPDLNNVEFVPHSDDMKNNVWSKTKILLMPSIYESYGMAGVEALASGIPVICSPTPGLIESQGPDGLFAERDDLDKWQFLIRSLLSDPEFYSSESNRASKRSAELDPKPEMAHWVSELEGLVRERQT